MDPIWLIFQGWDEIYWSKIIGKSMAGFYEFLVTSKFWWFLIIMCFWLLISVLKICPKKLWKIEWKRFYLFGDCMIDPKFSEDWISWKFIWSQCLDKGVNVCRNGGKSTTKDSNHQFEYSETKMNRIRILPWKSESNFKGEKICDKKIFLNFFKHPHAFLETSTIRCVMSWIAGILFWILRNSMAWSVFTQFYFTVSAFCLKNTD